jgi:hypothetical protein
MHVDMAVLRMLRELHDVGLLTADELVEAPRHVTEQRAERGRFFVIEIRN